SGGDAERCGDQTLSQLVRQTGLAHTVERPAGQPDGSGRADASAVGAVEGTRPGSSWRFRILVAGQRGPGPGIARNTDADLGPVARWEIGPRCAARYKLPPDSSNRRRHAPSCTQRKSAAGRLTL